MSGCLQQTPAELVDFLAGRAIAPIAHGQGHLLCASLTSRGEPGSSVHCLMGDGRQRNLGLSWSLLGARPRCGRHGGLSSRSSVGDCILLVTLRRIGALAPKGWGARDPAGTTPSARTGRRKACAPSLLGLVRRLTGRTTKEHMEGTSLWHFAAFRSAVISDSLARVGASKHNFVFYSLNPRN